MFNSQERPKPYLIVLYDTKIQPTEIAATGLPLPDTYQAPLVLPLEPTSEGMLQEIRNHQNGTADAYSENHFAFCFIVLTQQKPKKFEKNYNPEYFADIAKKIADGRSCLMDSVGIHFLIHFEPKGQKVTYTAHYLGHNFREHTISTDYDWGGIEYAMNVAGGYVRDYPNGEKPNQDGAGGAGVTAPRPNVPVGGAPGYKRPPSHGTEYPGG